MSPSRLAFTWSALFFSGSNHRTAHARRILLELDPTDDPVWIFFDTQHRHIMQVLRTTADASLSRIRLAMDQYGAADRDDRRQAAVLRSCVQSLETYDGERIRGEHTHTRAVSLFPLEYRLGLTDLRAETQRTLRAPKCGDSSSTLSGTSTP